MAAILGLKNEPDLPQADLPADSLPANCPQAASISLPLLLLILVMIPFFLSDSANKSSLSIAVFSKLAKEMGLYSIKFTLHGMFLQNAARSAASSRSSLKWLNTIYS